MALSANSLNCYSFRKLNKCSLYRKRESLILAKKSKILRPETVIH